MGQLPLDRGDRCGDDRQEEPGQEHPGRTAPATLTYTTVEADGVTTEPTAPVVPGFEPENAADLDSGSSWAGTWTAPTDSAGAPCEPAAGAPSLVLRFEEPTRVDRLGLYVGLPASSGDRERQSGRR